MAPKGKQASSVLTTPERFPTADAWRQGRRWRRWRKLFPMLCGIVLVIIMILVAALAPWCAPFSPSEQFSAYVLKGPGAGGKHLLGTDEFGRDLLSRIIWGARVSLHVGLAAVVVGFALGVPLGITAGFLGGRVAMLIMRLTDMLMAFPTLLLALIIVAALGGSLVNEILAIGIALTPNFTRLARSLALTIRAHDYIMAARALGCPVGTIESRLVRIRRQLKANMLLALRNEQRD